MKLSIITITYNNAEGLYRTIQSVQSQTFRDFEHIIVDGGSTDGSVEIIRQYTDNEAIRLQGRKRTAKPMIHYLIALLPHRLIAMKSVGFPKKIGESLTLRTKAFALRTGNTAISSMPAIRSAMNTY